MARLTWRQIEAIEPRLARLYVEAKAVRASKNFCANEIWYRSMRPRLVRLVGWDAGDKRLKTQEAYDLAYRKIYEALPDCRHESNISCL